MSDSTIPTSLTQQPSLACTGGNPSTESKPSKTFCTRYVQTVKCECGSQESLMALKDCNCGPRSICSNLSNHALFLSINNHRRYMHSSSTAEISLSQLKGPCKEHRAMTRSRWPWRTSLKLRIAAP